jgi:tyrosinase
MRTILTIEGANSAGANYIAWAPVRASIRVVEVGSSIAPINVRLRNQTPARGGQVVFFSSIPSAPRDQLQLQLPANGNPVDFFVAGKVRRPSVADKDAVIEVVQTGGTVPLSGPPLSTTSLMVRIRKNANKLTPAERNRFLSALASLNPTGTGVFSDFASIHTEAGKPEAHNDFGFLPWHRSFLLDLERELQKVDASVALPYWKFDEVARNLFTRAFMGVSVNESVSFDPSNPIQAWSIRILRGVLFNPITSSPVVLSEAQTLDLGNPGALFGSFTGMEISPHGDAHRHFTGHISRIATAARDPLFFLLHANVDRLWAKWQKKNGRFNVASTATYPFQGAAGSPGARRVGHNLLDTMWPWNGITGHGRPPTAPGGPLPDSPVTAAPGPKPTVSSMIDYQGVVSPANRLGFDYDDVGFGP